MSQVTTSARQAKPREQTNRLRKNKKDAVEDEDDVEDEDEIEDGDDSSPIRPPSAEPLSNVPRAVSSNNPFRRLQEQRRLPQQIVTEAGTPDSQKSTERFQEFVDTGATVWSL
ncbi:hypothetical protein PG997_010733 [Apiospora hydei]|uniref:Uncharacterized protein n=1 Tax=Apiospora hydei TaxID=1337664 RepID=A0ABR1VH56_9PEZI